MKGVLLECYGIISRDSLRLFIMGGVTIMEIETGLSEELAIVRSSANSIAGVSLISCHREIIQAKIQLYVQLKLPIVSQCLLVKLTTDIVRLSV